MMTYHRQVCVEHHYDWFRSVRDSADFELLILDDAGMYEDHEEDAGGNRLFRLVSVDKRYPSLADKRNAGVRMASHDHIWILDDDDLPTFDAIECIRLALKRHQVVAGGFVYQPDYEAKKMQMRRTWSKQDGFVGFQSTWGFSREAFEKAGGYKSGTNNGEDRVLQKRFIRTKNIPFVVNNPYVIWGPKWPLMDNKHLCSMGQGDLGYQKLAAKQHDGEKIKIKPRKAIDFSDWSLDMDNVLPRGW